MFQCTSVIILIDTPLVPYLDTIYPRDNIFNMAIVLFWNGSRIFESFPA